MTVDELYEKLGELRDQGLGPNEIRAEVSGGQEINGGDVMDVIQWDNGNIVIQVAEDDN